ncbi:uncharacterized protein LOC113642200 [Tachysurus ichikawai]
MYQGLAHLYRMAGVEKAQYQWVGRDCCAAYRVPDPEKSEHLNWDAWQTVDTVILEPANPTKQHIREHCRTKILIRTSQEG